MFAPMTNDNDLGTHWPVPSAVTYIEVADRLLLMAAQAKSVETQLQFEQLAKLYEKLAATAVQSSEIAATAHRLTTDVAVASPIPQH
jgi:hypothetical protein